jgi:hypothetical protein
MKINDYNFSDRSNYLEIARKIKFDICYKSVN